ncbi:MAG: type IV secretory system conjugative DNA transfer family protein [Pseudomonadales bacterium]|nr:type IV secretory system conjugative DNA transfer family protein [Pseudomonadales bacterium]
MDSIDALKRHKESAQFFMRNFDDKETVLKVLALCIPLLLFYVYTFSIVAGLFIKYFDAYKNPLFLYDVVKYDIDIPWGVALFANSIPYVITAVMLYESNRLRKIHGDAHFASEREIKIAGLRADSGIIVGKKNGKYLIVDGNEHVLCYCPPGSGKSTGLTIPNLLNWPDSVVVLDVKLEAYKKTSGFRESHGQNIFLWAPADKDGNTARFNPLTFIPSCKIQRIDEAQKVSATLLPPENDKGEVWQPEARTLLVGLVLLLIDLKGSTTFGKILRYVRSSNDLKDKLQSVISTFAEIDPISVRAFNAFCQKATKEASSVLTTLMSSLELFENPVIDAATSETDFDIRNLRKEKMSIYVGVSPGNLARLSPILNMFFQQVIREMTEKEPGEDEPYQVLGLFDEFASLGRVGIIEKGVAYLRGYHMRLLIIIQGVSQLEGEYGRAGAKTFMQSCKIKYVSAQNDFETAREVSGMLGYKTVRSVSKTTPLAGGKGGGSMSVSYQKKELMQPHEVMQLKAKQTLVLVEANPPILAKKIAYYKVKEMLDRSNIEPSEVKKLDLEAFYADIQKEFEDSRRSDLELKAKKAKAKREALARKGAAEEGNNSSYSGYPEMELSEADLDAALDELL